MTKEEIKAKIPSLSDEQAAAVADVAVSVGATAKAELTRELYTNLENDVLEVTGKKKPDGEKTYRFFREVLSEGKEAQSKAQKAKDEYNDLKAKYDSLAEKAESGSGAGERATQLEKELEKAKAKAERLEQDLTAKSEAWEAKFTEQAQTFEQERFTNVVNNALSALPFKDGLSDYVIDLAKRDVVAKVAGMTREWTDDGRVEFKDESGLVLRDPTTSKPLTEQDILKRELGTAGMLAENQSQGGAGSKPAPTASTQKGSFALNGEASQVQATRSLEDHLIGQGLSIGSTEYQAAFDQAFSEVIAPAELPIKA